MIKVALVNEFLYQNSISFNCSLIYIKVWINKLDWEWLSKSNIATY